MQFVLILHTYVCILCYLNSVIRINTSINVGFGRPMGYGCKWKWANPLKLCIHKTQPFTLVLFFVSKLFVWLIAGCDSSNPQRLTVDNELQVKYTYLRINVKFAKGVNKIVSDPGIKVRVCCCDNYNLSARVGGLCNSLQVQSWTEAGSIVILINDSYSHVHLHKA